MENIQHIKLINNTIEKILMKGREQKICIFPYGEIGKLVKSQLNNCYGIQEFAIIDNHYARFNPKIHKSDFLKSINQSDLAVIFAYMGDNAALFQEISSYVNAKQIYSVFPKEYDVIASKQQYTKCGKYSYGPLTDNVYVKEVGAFCSFSLGTCVVNNHIVNGITTHPMLYYGENDDFGRLSYENYKNQNWYFEGVIPHAKIEKERKITIGNDVWLGRNVIITNYANIGNGVIAGAGAVITKDVPDYAIVGGVPARIIRYRYKPEQIEALNKIQWWSWPDEKIRECYEDFYLDVEDFIAKHIND